MKEEFDKKIGIKLRNYRKSPSGDLKAKTMAYLDANPSYFGAYQIVAILFLCCPLFYFANQGVETTGDLPTMEQRVPDEVSSGEGQEPLLIKEIAAEVMIFKNTQKSTIFQRNEIRSSGTDQRNFKFDRSTDCALEAIKNSSSDDSGFLKESHFHLERKGLSFIGEMSVQLPEKLAEIHLVKYRSGRAATNEMEWCHQLNIGPYLSYYSIVPSASDELFISSVEKRGNMLNRMGAKLTYGLGLQLNETIGLTATTSYLINHFNYGYTHDSDEAGSISIIESPEITRVVFQKESLNTIISKPLHLFEFGILATYSNGKRSRFQLGMNYQWSLKQEEKYEIISGLSIQVGYVRQFNTRSQSMFVNPYVNYPVLKSTSVAPLFIQPYQIGLGWGIEF